MGPEGAIWRCPQKGTLEVKPMGPCPLASVELSCPKECVCRAFLQGWWGCIASSTPGQVEFMFYSLCFHKQLRHLTSCMAHGIIEDLQAFSSTTAKQATTVGNELARDRHSCSSNMKEVPKIILKARLYCSHSNAWWKSWTCFWSCNTTSGDYRVLII